MDEKVAKILFNNKIRNRLIEAGIYPIGITGPTGPMGKGLEILGSYSTLAELEKAHPTGRDGDNYIVDGSIYIWDDRLKMWTNIGRIQGEKGDKGDKGDTGDTGVSDKIVVRSTMTGDAGTEAMVNDTKMGLTHYLDFIIPKGETGKQGAKGEKGDNGVSPPLPQTSYRAILFISFAQINYSSIMSFQDVISIPSDNNILVKDTNQEFSVKEKGYYEITLCGQISGVDADHGAIFYLSNKAGTIIQDLSFELKAGSTSRMDCSETVITKIDTPTNMYVRCGITGDNNTSKVDFANVNLIIKKYNVDIE